MKHLSRPSGAPRPVRIIPFIVTMIMVVALAPTAWSAAPGAAGGQ